MVTLLPHEERLTAPFNQPGLEAVRRGSIAAICGASDVTLRIRALTLTAHNNPDFRAVFADVLVVPAAILAERITKPRALFTVNSELSLLREVWPLALQELRGLGLSDGYCDLVAARLSSDAPQYVVAAACSIMLFGGMLAPSYVMPPAPPAPIIPLVAEQGPYLVTEDGVMLEA